MLEGMFLLDPLIFVLSDSSCGPRPFLRDSRMHLPHDFRAVVALLSLSYCLNIELGIAKVFKGTASQLRKYIFTRSRCCNMSSVKGGKDEKKKKEEEDDRKRRGGIG